ncbi:hypothetical protein MSBR2_1008 [Methanosarcina barkeri 227]|uniref:Uncharacterized protein n=2 Tax=Methanosarcina barkeri TaxID=2208 RepID=A0A0G3CBL6_METBA|nr:hypothetical protein MSBR2_1008 [Methanosarcina barkeri 227]AKJ38075.1 hypothetical protein MCM1_1012 [Methanosarcina barkeri CM1]
MELKHERWVQTVETQSWYECENNAQDIEIRLVAAGIPESTICVCTRDKLNSIRHYQGLTFSEDEIWAIRAHLTEWSFKAS